MDVLFLAKRSSGGGHHAMARTLLRISGCTASLVAASLLVNSVVRPYSDLIHDARLYSIQVLDQIRPGVYSDDLYLRYGSQDKFSVFSRVLAPAADTLGIREAFFVVYLASVVLFFVAAWKYFRTISRSRLAGAAAMIYLAVAPVHFGGLGVFQVNETMLTPRLAAIGFVLLSLAAMASHRVGRALLFLIPAFLIHPVMAFGGFLAWIWYVGSWSLKDRHLQLATVVLGAAGVAFLLWRPVASQILGTMDLAWHDAVVAANYYATPTKWELSDWFQIATAFAIVTVSRHQLRWKASEQRLLDAVLFVGAAAVLGGVIAPMLPYALPLQGQPYRALWLLQITQIPLVMTLARQTLRISAQCVSAQCVSAQCVSRSHHRIINSFLIACFFVGSMTVLQSICSLLAALCVYVRFAPSRGNQTTLQRLAPLAGLTAGATLIGVPLLMRLDLVSRLPMPFDIVRFVGPTWGPFFMTLGATLFLVWLFRIVANRSRFAMGCCLAFVAVQAFFWVGPGLAMWGGRLSVHEQRLAELRELLHQDRPQQDSLPTVYWPQSHLDDIWVHLRAKSFYTKQQTAGNMFHRDTAMEGRRRAQAVSMFEYAEFQRRCREEPCLIDWRTESLLHSLGITKPLAPPTPFDLWRLCQEPIDYAILADRFDGLFEQQVGPLYVYDCGKLRNSLTASKTRATVVQTHHPARSLHHGSPE